MPVMKDYLKWRGDLSFTQAPFCEADNLILSCLSYVNLDGIASSTSTPITLKEAADTFFHTHNKEELDRNRSFIKAAPCLLKEAAQTERFSNLLIQNYINQIDVAEELQFSAIEFLIDDGTSFIAYRGTDDNIIGWKEDFNMSLGNVPAQLFSVEYLNRVGSQSTRPLRIGGHSKGGHLAVYASALCEPAIQERIVTVYDNDGPGFLEDFLETQGFGRIQSRIKKFVPEFSVFGMLLNSATEPIIIKSSNTGISQHDIFTWQIEGPNLVRRNRLKRTAKVFSDSMKSWLSEMNAKEKEEFINDLFSVLEACGAETITGLSECGIKGIHLMAKKIESVNPNTRSKIESLLKIIWGRWTKQWIS